MSYSAIIGIISGALQFAVAAYALRACRRFGIHQIGWYLFGALGSLALVHTFLSVQPFGTEVDFGPIVNLFYEVVSVLLIASLVRAEVLLRKPQQTSASEPAALSRADTAPAQPVITSIDEAKYEEELATARQIAAQFEQAASRLEAELSQQRKSSEESRNAYEQQLAAQEQQIDAARETQQVSSAELNRLAAELSRLRQLEAARTSTAPPPPRPIEPHPEFRNIVAGLQAQLSEQKQTRETLEQKLRDLMENARQAQRVAPESTPPPAPRIDSDEQKQKADHLDKLCRDLIALFREAGIAEVAALSRTRVSHIAQIAKLIRANSKELSKFLTRNPRGKQLPEILTLQVQYLADEQFLLHKRIGYLKRKTDELGKAVSPKPEPAGQPEPQAVPSSNGAANKSSLEDHLIADVTETGTEPPAAGEATRRAYASMPNLASRGDVLADV